MKNPVDEVGPRAFVDRAGVLTVVDLTIPPELVAAYDLLEEYLVGRPPQKWVDLIAYAARTGRDPVALARKITELNWTLRTTR